MIGKTLGNYEIVGELGAGGMGEVYRARDTRLDREVAIKVLPEHIAGDPDVQTRFRREAQTISSMNHPHICVLHDVGEQDGVHYLVMELVDGLTLTQRLKKGPLPIADVIRYGAQIADALDRAHRAGIIHRDLKPGNVMITKSGAKLMDFGLARVARSGGLQEATVAISQEGLTAEGAIVGTFQYMAPEQLEGREVDQRSDLWALGCVLYEMATGQRAFEGASQASLIGSIMHAQPDSVSERVDVSPPEFDRLVSACLEKDPDDRVQSAHDIKLQLRWLSEGSSSGHAAPAIPVGRRRSWWPLVALLALVVGAAGAWFLRPSTPVIAESPQRYELGRWTLRNAMTPVISPDATCVVFAVQDGLTSRLYRRDLDELGAVPIEGTEGALAPFFSPDGRWVGYATEKAVHKVPFDGGIPQLVAAVGSINSADWGDDGMIYLSPGAGGIDGDVALMRVPQEGGEVEVYGRLEEEEATAWIPEVLPGSRVVLVSVLSRGQNLVYAYRPDGHRELLLTGAFMGRYTEQGYLFYRDDESEATMAVRFDPDALTMTGPSLAITDPIHANFCFDVSSSGMLVHVPWPDDQQGRYLTWMNRDGSSTRAAELPGSWAQPRVSPDGTKVVVRMTGAECQLWMLDLVRGSLSRLVQQDDTHDPVWAPDSKRILFNRIGVQELVVMDVAGSRRVEVIATGNERGSPRSWAGGNNLMAYTVTGPGGQTDIWVREMDGGSEGEPFVATPQPESQPAISPDGRWIAYESEETGVPEVYVKSWPDDGSVWQASAGGGITPLWSRDGSELYFVRMEDGSLMSVAVDATSDLALGIPEELIPRGLSASRRREFDVAPDGSFITAGGAQRDTELVVHVLRGWPQLIEEMNGR